MSCLSGIIDLCTGSEQTARRVSTAELGCVATRGGSYIPMMKQLLPTLFIPLALLPPPAFAQTPQPTAPQPTAPQPAAPKPTAPQPTATQGRAGGTALTLSVLVTDKSGNALGDTDVTVSGPVERIAKTDRDGQAAFRSMRAGAYRVRLEHDGFITLEREVIIRAGQPATVQASLNAAPPKPAEPVAPPPTQQPPPPPRRSTRTVEPRSFSIVDFLDKNFVKSEPLKTTLIGCSEGGTARLLQVRDPLNNQLQSDADLFLYVVAGSGILTVQDRESKAGTTFYAMVPRNVPYSIRRDTRNPVIVLAITAGSACLEGATTTGPGSR
jgi:mannose-6-phosphate isomerase-like protein (cupin superfamily)